MLTRESFIIKNDKDSLELLIGFLNIEVTEQSFSIIHNFLKVGNFRNGEYEGNTYILQKLDSDEVVITARIAEKSANNSHTSICLTVDEMLEVLDNIDYWKN